MCGIIAALSNKNIYDVIIQGLQQLQNRGYDSTGLSYMIKNNIHIYKDISDTKQLALEKLKSQTKYIRDNHTIHMIMAHTRWATNGKKNIDNAHPHISYDKKISIIHNGIIENYIQLQVFLKSKNIACQTETDSEVIAHIIAYHYSITNNIKKSLNSF